MADAYPQSRWIAPTTAFVAGSDSLAAAPQALAKAGLRYPVIAKPDIGWCSFGVAWNREVVRPLVEADPMLMRPIAEAAIMRLLAGARCFDRYRAEFGLEAQGETACGKD